LMKSMFFCWAQTLIYCNTPSRIFLIIKWLECYNILIFSTLQDLYVDMRRLIVSRRWFKVVTIFHHSIWFSIFVEVHGLDNFFVNINVGIKIGKTKLCSINIDMSSKRHCYSSKYKTWSFLWFIFFHLSF
jgi:hypothetical protein